MNLRTMEHRPDYLTRFTPKPDSLARDPVSVTLPKALDRYVRALPNRSAWLRAAIAVAVERELTLKED